MTATRTDISPPLSRIAIAIADYLIPLTADQRDDVIVRALCVVEDDSPAADTPIPYVPTAKAESLPMLDTGVRTMATEPVETVEPVEPMRPTSSRVAAGRKAATAEIEAAARSIVEVLSGHEDGLTKGALASALNFETTSGRFNTSLRHVVTSGRVRAQGNTNSRRYFPAGK